MMRTLKPWTDEDRARLTEAYAAGRSVDSIAAELDRTYRSVMSQAWLMRLCKITPRYTVDEERLMRRRKNEGWTYPQIARELGRSTNSVNAKFFKMRRR